jgi:tRNA threonylcarbamoyladenosine biosynthesis protein TsaB
MTIILAIESSSELASVALYQIDDQSPAANLTGANGVVRHRAVRGVQSHSENILPMVQALLAEAGIVLGQCDAIAFGAGPGSFTGVRTACAIAQGLAYGCGAPVVAVDTLAAAALACFEKSMEADVVVALDARMGQVYWAKYTFDLVETAEYKNVIPPRLDDPASLAALLASQNKNAFVACGNGFHVYRHFFKDMPWLIGLDKNVEVDEDTQISLMPHAAQVATLGYHLYKAGKATLASHAQPIYLRNDVALTTAQRRQLTEIRPELA